jgi:16S rRNA (guanine527-N7)-methyltransferase
MDIGSGGGSPAIPLKLASPSSNLTMVEVKARKSAFLREAVRTLGLQRTTVETSRYEELLARPDLHEAFGLLSLRAIRVEVRTLLTLQAFIKPGGLIFLFRGPSGPDAPEVVPPLRWTGTFPLVESMQSRLTVLQKVR